MEGRKTVEQDVTSLKDAGVGGIFPPGEKKNGFFSKKKLKCQELEKADAIR